MVMLNETHKLAFFGVPKVASSSVKRVLHDLDAAAEDGAAGGARKRLHWRYPDRPDVTADTLRGLEGYWRFALIRDPVRRILSAYGNRVLDERDLTKGRMPRLRAALLGVSLTPGPDAFILRLGRYRLQSGSIRHHTNPFRAFLGPDLGLFDAVYPIEEIARLEADLTARTGRPVSLPREKSAAARGRSRNWVTGPLRSCLT